MNREQKRRWLWRNRLWCLLLAVSFPTMTAAGGQNDASAPTSVSTEFLNTLSAPERAWLRDHPVIRVVQDPNWPPIEFTDEHGAPSGMTGDYLKLIEQRLGLKFERVLNLSWQEAYARLKRWEIDLTTTVAVTSERTAFWTFTKPYMTIPIVIVTRADVTYIADLRELAGKKVAVVDGYVANIWISRDFPEIQLVRVKTTLEGLTMLQRGEVSACVENMLVVGYYMAKQKMTELKITGTSPYNNAQCMAVRNDWALLAGILDKALDSVSATERRAIYRRWLPIRYEHGFDYTRLWPVAAIFTIVLLGLVAWNWKLAAEIRQRKQAEAALRESEHRLRFHVENSPLAVVEWDRNFLVTRWSGEAETMFGWSAAETIGQPLGNLNIIYEEDLPVVQNTMKRLTDGASKQIVSTNRNYAKDRRIIYCEWYNSVLSDQQGNMISVMSQVLDVTARQQAEAALKESAQMIEVIINAIPVRVFWKDKQLVYLGCNAAFAHDAGFVVPKDLIGKDDFQMGWREQAELYRADDRAVIESGCAKLRIEEAQTTPTGGTLTLLTSKLPLLNSKGEIYGVVGVYMDITDRKQAEEALRQKAEALRASNAELEQFNRAMVGRELRMIELKQEINELCGRLGDPPRHATVE